MYFIGDIVKLTDNVIGMIGGDPSPPHKTIVINDMLCEVIACHPDWSDVYRLHSLYRNWDFDCSIDYIASKVVSNAA